LDSLAARLEKAEVAVRRPPRSIAELRHVKDLIAFADPAGNTIEAFHGLEAATTPFEPGRPISGFRTGSLGMGHIVLNCESYGPMVPFYRDLLGFRFSDFLVTPFKGQFFHVNPRHHSFALIENGRKGIHHLMLELNNLDDVGQGYDLALGEEKRIATTLGRHANDWMTSFYVFSPSGFMVEYGWGGREVDMASWQAGEMKNGPSLWGHERAWLPPAVRALTREMTLGAAAAGVRHPVQVTDGNYQTGPEKIE
jgi:2,3-dihydroxybiphenyl 1,2-dioxygenase